MTIYLYKKTHKDTGLKYLGKTIAKDPYLYPGSGLYWKHHLEKHGNNVETEVLRECQTEDELKEWGQYYSKLWNVVESKEWANLIEEAGPGGYWSIESKQKLSKSVRRALLQLTKEQLTERMKKSCCKPESYTTERIEKSRLGMIGKKKTKTSALLAAEEARRNRTPDQKLKCGLANKNKTWKLVDGKRVWMEKI
jgi:hypothetical protein